MSAQTESKEDNSEEPEHRRVKYVIIFGVLFVTISLLLTMGVTLVDAYSGLPGSSQFIHDFAYFTLVVGLIMIALGLISLTFSELLSKDGLWIIKTGPYVK